MISPKAAGESYLSASFAQSAGLPESISRPWPRDGRTASRFSTAPFGLPGRFTMRLLARMPACARESIARGVICIEA